MSQVFRDRQHAGRLLGEALQSYAHQANVVVIGIPRGGVRVAFEVARRLGVPLDALVVRKLGAPSHPELALGAITSGGGRVLNTELIEQTGVSLHTLERIEARERHILERYERTFRGERPPMVLRDQTVILVDDGLATGATMRAAAQVIRGQQPERLVVAVPVAPLSTVRALEREVDEVVCLTGREFIGSVGGFFGSFPQLKDAEVRDILHQAHHHAPGDASPPAVTPR
jgi:putative phosphoribosyl transferase